MSFDKFLLAVESRDLSQADKSIISKDFPAFRVALVGGSKVFNYKHVFLPKAVFE